MALFRGAIGTLRKGLAKTRDALAGSLRSLLSGRTLDDELIREIEKRLIQADVGVSGTRTLIDGIKDAYKRGAMKSGDEALEYLKREIKAMWPARDRELIFAETAPTVILVTGINGVGKTTSIAKLAKLLRDQNKTVLLGACDTFRAGAVRQLEIWGERLGVEVVKGQQGGDPAAVAFDACAAAKARGVDVLILDTAGRLHTQSGLMDQLSKIRRVIEKQIEGGPHETLLVLDATSGSNALRQAQEFDAATNVTGIMLSKLDGTARGGIVVAIRSAVDIPVKLVGLGETPEDVAPFDPESFVDAMFEIDG
jgi:fused signal recognition particle receptor